MIERWQNDDGSETVLITRDAPRPSLLSRLLGLVGRGFLVLLFGAFPLYLLIVGIRGIARKKLNLWSRSTGDHILYGYEAVGWSWLLIGFAFGFVPFVFREELARWLKWSLWLITTVCFLVGIWCLVKGN